MTLARARDALLVRSGPNGRAALVLNILRARDPRSRAAKILPGIEAASGEIMVGQTSRTKLVIPVSCSKWHEQKFLSGRAILRSSVILRRDRRWFMCAQFEFEMPEMRLTGARLGVDRGIVNPVAMSVVSVQGRVLAVPAPMGSEIGDAIRGADEKRRAEQRRRGATGRQHVERVEQSLHLLSNRIVAAAKSHGAQVVVEKLGGLKQMITSARAKGARKGGWRRALKKAQLGKLEQLLSYKLIMAGLPKLVEVVAGGTSITCPACARRDKQNRRTQDEFACVRCGFAAHADTVGAVNIARRGIAMKDIKKGAKLAPIEQDMVARLRSGGDGGLGPLAASASSGFVAARASADTANEGAGAQAPNPLTVTAEQEATHAIQNARERVIAERNGAISPAPEVDTTHPRQRAGP